MPGELYLADQDKYYKSSTPQMANGSPETALCEMCVAPFQSQTNPPCPLSISFLEFLFMAVSPGGLIFRKNQGFFASVAWRCSGTIISTTRC